MNNIFHAFTRRCLKENRTRTLATIVGIVLSMSLFTAVIEGAYSGIMFLRRSEAADNGAWNAYVIETTASQVEEIVSKKQVKDSATWSEVGWAHIETDNDYKPYLLIESMGEGFSDMVAVHLVDGRMPENENEILLPEHLARNGNLFIPSGTELELEIGKRLDSEGRILPHSTTYMPGEESLTKDFTKSYTVVGHYVRFQGDIESYSSPGYTALTVGKANGQTDVFFELKNPASYNKFVSKMAEEGILDTNKLITHYELLHMYGITGAVELTSVIWGFAAILIVLIFFGSVSVIYNSFSISVSERTKLYGILKSVGATKKQIRSTVNYEAAFLAAIGIPAGLLVGCVGIGITLYCLRDNFSHIMSTPTDVQMKLVLNPWVLLLAAVICFITTMVSANRPAGRAIRISPIDSLRQTEDVSIKAREVKTSKLTQKLFGFEGMLASKNFKRNKKRYRSVVLSLFMSVVLFISASSFCSYLTAAVNDTTGYSFRSRIDICYDFIGADMDTAEETMELLSGIPGVKSSFMMSETYEYAAFDEKDLSKEIQDPKYQDYMDSWIQKPGYVTLATPVLIISDEMFREYCKGAGVDPDDFMDKDSPKALLINTKEIWAVGRPDILSEGSLPATCRFLTVKDVEGYTYRETEEKDGKTLYLYYPEEYMESYWNGAIDSLEREKALELDENEALLSTDLTIGALAGEDAIGLFGNRGCLIYPYSMAKTVFGSEKAEDYTFAKEMYFSVDNHKAVYDAMKAALSEKGLNTSRLVDYAEDYEGVKMMVTVINVFCYGFIILISLIALTNVFNTISTNIILRRREFAMLKSIGMSEKGFSKMMNYECVIYGVKGLSLGIPVSILTTYVIFMVARDASEDMSFFIPLTSFAVAIGSVFIVVFATMIFAMKKIRNDNPIDALKNENI